MVGVKEERWRGDDVIRPALPATPSELDAGDGRMLRAHQALIGLRRRNPWLLRARSDTVDLSNTRYVYRTRSGQPGESLEVTLDVTETPWAEIRTEAGEVCFSSR